MLCPLSFFLLFAMSYIIVSSFLDNYSLVNLLKDTTLFHNNISLQNYLSHNVYINSSPLFFLYQVNTIYRCAVQNWAMRNCSNVSPPTPRESCLKVPRKSTSLSQVGVSHVKVCWSCHQYVSHVTYAPVCHGNSVLVYHVISMLIWTAEIIAGVSIRTGSLKVQYWSQHSLIFNINDQSEFNQTRRFI